MYEKRELIKKVIEKLTAGGRKPFISRQNFNLDHFEIDLLLPADSKGTPYVKVIVTETDITEFSAKGTETYKLTSDEYKNLIHCFRNGQEIQK